MQARVLSILEAHKVKKEVNAVSSTSNLASDSPLLDDASVHGKLVFIHKNDGDSQPLQTQENPSPALDSSLARLVSETKIKEGQDTFKRNSRLTNNLSSFVRRGSDTTTTSRWMEETQIICAFQCLGLSGAPVWVSAAAQKSIVRMREKIYEYYEIGAEWPLTACILDPVRASVVCDGPAQMMEVINWILSGDSTGMSVCKIKNKFSMETCQLVSYDNKDCRKLSFTVVFCLY